jgi:hypothetical protein
LPAELRCPIAEAKVKQETGLFTKTVRNASDCFEMLRVALKCAEMLRNALYFHTFFDCSSIHLRFLFVLSSFIVRLPIEGETKKKRSRYEENHLKAGY